MQLIFLEKQKDVKCDITITYHPKPEKDKEFEIAGLTYRNGTDNQNIAIYFLNIELERTDYMVYTRKGNRSLFSCRFHT